MPKSFDRKVILGSSMYVGFGAIVAGVALDCRSTGQGPRPIIALTVQNRGLNAIHSFLCGLLKNNVIRCKRTEAPWHRKGYSQTHLVERSILHLGHDS